jgi:hypothetical protein
MLATITLHPISILKGLQPPFSPLRHNSENLPKKKKKIVGEKWSCNLRIVATEGNVGAVIPFIHDQIGKRGVCDCPIK